MSELIVVKVGTGVLTRVADGRLDGGSLVRLVAGLAEQVRAGRRIILVSSGAVGAGVSALGLSRYPDVLAEKQAAAAVGQARLMHVYENLFSHFDLCIAQVLLTGRNLRSDEVSSRVKDTMDCLFERDNIVPIINQNDSIAVEELSQGDNDMLSVQIALLLKADKLILLTSADGLCESDGGKLIPEVKCIEEAKTFAEAHSGKFSTGGMSSKLSAVEVALEAGVEVIIGNGRKPERLADIVEGKGTCTRFPVEK